jgi:Zn finger protein HypA/HybF involved in hydrogenase expression
MKSCSANTSSPKSSSSSRTKTPTSNRKSLDPSSLRNSLTKTPSTSSPSSKGSPTPKDPTSVTCHVCGRPFGTRSIASHIPKCKENYAQIQSKLPSKSMRKNPPSDPTIPLPTDTKSSDFDLQLQAYNDEAYSIYEQQARNQCNYCKKKFDAEKIEQHVNVCVKKPKESSSEGSGMVPKLGEKPATLFCYLCGREFGLQSLDIHIPQCIKKREAVQEQLPKELRCKAPKGPTIPYPTDKGSETFKEDLEAFNQQAYRIYEDSSRLQCKGCGRRFNAEALLVHLKSCAPAQEKMAQSAPSGPASRPRMLICSICGREFGSKSLPIHQKQCLLKHGMSEDDLPKMQQQMPINAGKMSAEELDKFNEKAFSNFTEKYVFVLFVLTITVLLFHVRTVVDDSCLTVYQYIKDHVNQVLVLNQ